MLTIFLKHQFYDACIKLVFSEILKNFDVNGKSIKEELIIELYDLTCLYTELLKDENMPYQDDEPFSVFYDRLKIQSVERIRMLLNDINEDLRVILMV